MKKTISMLFAAIVFACATTVSADYQDAADIIAPSIVRVPSPNTSAAGAKQGQSLDAFYSATSWDLDISGGIGSFGFAKDSAQQTFGFGRVRAGLLKASWPFIFLMGPTYEYNNLSAATFGIQIEAIHISSGLWMQAGPMLDYKSQAGVMTAIGWSFLGIEGQYRGYEDYGYGPAVLVKARVPIGVIAYALGRNDRAH